MNQKVAEPRQFGELHRQGRIDRQMENERGPVGGRVASEIEPDARQGTARHAVHARAVAHDEERINFRAAVLRVPNSPERACAQHGRVEGARP